MSQLLSSPLILRTTLFAINASSGAWNSKCTDWLFTRSAVKYVISGGVRSTRTGMVTVCHAPSSRTLERMRTV